jgi:CheY-like chemotaxis protein
MFVSANTKTDEILQGFDAGGVDYLTKPIDEKVLLSKVSLVIHTSSKWQSLENEHKVVTELVTTVLSNTGNLSVLFNFLRAGLKLVSHKELADKLIQACRDFSLDGCIQIRNDDVINASTSGMTSPLEEELLARSADMEGRILERGSRIIVCFESISILIKNIPVDNEVTCGEIKDNLIFIAEDSHNLNLKLGHDKKLNNHRISIISQALKESQSALVESEIDQKEHKQKSIKIMDELMAEIEGSYIKMELSDEQENFISDIITKKVFEALDHMEGGLHMDEKMKSITKSLGEIAKSL